MVRAILEGRKTQTRRICKNGEWLKSTHKRVAGGYVGSIEPIACPYGVAGDRLWVRETWAACDWKLRGTPARGEAEIAYGADAPVPIAEWEAWRQQFDRFRPSIHMPRWASRITLEVTSVRVQRLQEITEEDAMAEGVTPFPKDPEGDCWSDGTHRSAFEYLWGNINGFPGEARGVGKSWIENPWVWAVSFKRVTS